MNDREITELAAMSALALDPDLATALRRRMITGTAVALHGADDGEEKPDGRRQVVLLSVVDVPPEMDIKGLHQYVVTGNANGELHLHTETAQDRSELKGQGAASILTSPIWRT